RPVPGWSSLLAREGVAQTPSPFADPALAARSSLDDPLPVSWNGAAGHAFLTASPPELCPAGRTFDLDALLYTAATARERLSISVMHFTPLEWPRHAPRSAAIWWHRLQDALLRAYLRGVQVRLLVSRWPHSHPSMLALTSALQQTARAIGAAERESSASSDKREMQQGSLQVRAFTMPGWDETTGPERRYPGHSRVNHAKYMVSERRVNVGTSNMGWHDFYLNAGISLNSDHPGLVHDLQALFDRDWRSAYAIPVEALQESSM
ncbi:MAG: PLD-like domain-containing protein, partial [Candidatus Promineifilaceae bacterium]|nr:PLD-like domain-containing protein [Candidatus Promineifilaceae bacterium]